MYRTRIFAAATVLSALVGWQAPADSERQGSAFEQRLATQVQPFLARYCFSCHGPKKHKASLDLSRDTTVQAIAANAAHWELVLERLQANEMPPAKAPRQPSAQERTVVVAWLRKLCAREAARNAGDPGPVLARRLSNVEYDYTIHDLTGVDIRPAREFPVDPANEAGFDNSGESLAMSPELLKKYLAAARLVADHVVLKPEGFVFAPHPVVTDTDRDKYCVKRIIDFYGRHQVDYTEYFLAAWRYRQRDPKSQPTVTLKGLAAESRLSARYLPLVWSALNDGEVEGGPLAALRKLWRELPDAKSAPADVRAGCGRMADLVARLRRELKPDIKKLTVKGISPGSQPLVLWRNREFAGNHRSYRGHVVRDLAKLGEQAKKTNAGLAALFAVKANDAASLHRLRSDLERFCHVFPDAFVVSDRGPYFDPKQAGKGRLLTAGFHLMQGYFRDDQPLCDLILTEGERQELEALWQELNFITLVPLRQYKDFIFFERAEPPRYMREAEFDFARSEDRDAVSQTKMQRLAEVYLARARKIGAPAEALAAIETYFAGMSAEILRVAKARLTAEPSHLAALLKFAERAYRRPLSSTERAEFLAFYQRLRRQEELGHEDALRDTVASVLMSPHFCYRFFPAEAAKQDPSARTKSANSKIRPLSDYELASRLSYFLWSSMPDAELLSHAAAGDLHRPDILKAQTRRMLRDSRVRRLATEFAGNWLDFRRFEEHNAVDRQRFPSFTNELRQAMFEEPIRYVTDIAQRNRSVLELLYGNDTFVNRALARHYGMPEPSSSRGAMLSRRELQGRSPANSGRAGMPPDADDWVHVTDAHRYGRGGMLPMAVFLTKNAPGLRTSPVKRGYWVVRRVLGERIPPPPPTVPELPRDEADLGKLTLAQALARHRSDESCAGCHRRFDSVGLIFEGFGPIGERRTRDLGGRPIETVATFPDGKSRAALEGLRDYLREKRQPDFVDNLCKKLFSYALGRSLLLSDKKALDQMRVRLAAENYALGGLVEDIVTSPQFVGVRNGSGANQH